MSERKRPCPPPSTPRVDGNEVLFEALERADKYSGRWERLAAFLCKTHRVHLATDPNEDAMIAAVEAAVGKAVEDIINDASRKGHDTLQMSRHVLSVETQLARMKTELERVNSRAMEAFKAKDGAERRARNAQRSAEEMQSEMKRAASSIAKADAPLRELREARASHALQKVELQRVLLETVRARVAAQAAIKLLHPDRRCEPESFAKAAAFVTQTVSATSAIKQIVSPDAWGEARRRAREV